MIPRIYVETSIYLPYFLDSGLMQELDDPLKSEGRVTHFECEKDVSESFHSQGGEL